VVNLSAKLINAFRVNLRAKAQNSFAMNVRPKSLHQLCLGVLLVGHLWVSPTVFAASLHGDPQCQDWPQIELPVKQRWLNAILAPMNMTFMSRVRPPTDKYAQLGSLEPVLEWMDNYCRTQPKQPAINGAVQFFEELTAR